jgi:DNA mismatch repair protein MutS2
LRQRIEREHEKAAVSARAEARRILEEARRAADEAAREIARMRQAGSSEDLPELRRKLNEAENALASAGDDARGVEEPAFDKPPAAGTEVVLAATGIRATVLGVPDKNGLIPLQAGIMKVTAALGDIRPSEPKKDKKSKSAGVSVSQTPIPLQTELDLRGQPTDDGVLLMERFIDDAVIKRLQNVTDIHGKGTGALRAAVHAALRKNKSVKGFRLGRYGEGETGVTVVTLKEG